MPAPDLPLLIEAARAAGDIALRFWKSAPETWEKAANAGPVTEADLAIDRMLRAELGAARPGYGWLSEETEDCAANRLGAERLFIVDPIDGTRAFIAGEDGFAHALAVVEDGAVTAAAIYLPARDEMYAATAGGATLNGLPIHASVVAEPAEARVLATHQAMAESLWQGGHVPGFRRSFRTALAWRMCLVAAGRYDATFSFRRIWEWDLAAGDLIARAAGARVTDARGAAIRYNSPSAQAAGVVAAAPALHAALMPQLALPADLAG